MESGDHTTYLAETYFCAYFIEMCTCKIAQKPHETHYQVYSSVHHRFFFQLSSQTHTTYSGSIALWLRALIGVKKLGSSAVAAVNQCWRITDDRTVLCSGTVSVNTVFLSLPVVLVIEIDADFNTADTYATGLQRDAPDKICLVPKKSDTTPDVT